MDIRIMLAPYPCRAFSDVAFSGLHRLKSPPYTATGQTNTALLFIGVSLDKPVFILDCEHDNPLFGENIKI
jgi:hypothetical protein